MNDNAPSVKSAPVVTPSPKKAQDGIGRFVAGLESKQLETRLRSELKALGIEDDLALANPSNLPKLQRALAAALRVDVFALLGEAAHALKEAGE